MSVILPDVIFPGGWEVILVDDWFCYVRNQSGVISSIVTECHPLWRQIPGDPWADDYFNDEGVLFIGVTMLKRGEDAWRGGQWEYQIDAECWPDVEAHAQRHRQEMRALCDGVEP